MHSTRSINSPYADEHGRLDPLDGQTIAALGNDPALTVSGVVYPSISVRHGHADGADVEVYDPLTDQRIIVALDGMGLASLVDVLGDIQRDNTAQR